jgi:hypothetical protein
MRHTRLITMNKKQISKILIQISIEISIFF